MNITLANNPPKTLFKPATATPKAPPIVAKPVFITMSSNPNTISVTGFNISNVFLRPSIRGAKAFAISSEYCTTKNKAPI
jgi:hypothetical protein